MDITAPCIRLLMDVFVLLVAHADHSYFAQRAVSDAAFPRISPDRLQFFEYETLTISCEEFGGLSEWRVMRKLNKTTPTESYNWNSSAASCTIHPTFKRHSGEYWCEDAQGNQSDVLNISITDGSVILDVPTRPVVAGYDVILHCRKEKTQAKHIADFYKDGVKLGTWYENNMTIHNVSKSDEGLYKCRISGAGESPESWLSVLNQNETAYEETRPSDSDSLHLPSLHLPSLLWIVGSVLSVALVLLVVGLLLCRKHRVLVFCSCGKQTPGSQPHEGQPVSGEENDVDPPPATYAVVKKQRKKKVSAGDNAVDQDNVTYAVVTKQKKKKEPGGTKPHLPDESVTYACINYRPLATD
ncbi:uncharacterized protein LOC127379590 [Dicentrarchus labrax]|uniref:uncharacterized protein LOC127379590 n=1 Tax=Dicentrarchus labrax TaxID=13489 RepID=UPI0021F616D9|nr:uncharacterized protein LOC127379590 [Dicentrarchus labrax]